MRHKPLAVIVISALALSGCTAQLISTQVPKTPPTGAAQPLDGLFYALPQTVVNVKLPVTFTKAVDGPHKPYLDLFFPEPAKNPPVAESKLKLGTPEFSVRGEADPRQVYVVKATGRGAVQQTLTFGFKEDGAVTGIKAEVTNVTSDLVISGIKGLVSIATRTLLAGSSGAKNAKPLDDESKEDPINCEDPTPSKDVSPERRTEYFKQCVLKDDRLILNFALLKSGAQQYVDNYFDDLEKRRNFLRALADYNQIRDLMDGRAKALERSDGGPKQDVILTQNEAEVAKLMQLFLVKKTVVSWTGNFEILPDECDSKRQERCTGDWISPEPALITYAKAGGLCIYDSDRHRGKLPPASILAKQADCTQTNAVTLSLSPHPKTDQTVFRLAGNFKLPAKPSLHFVVPLRVQAQLQDTPHNGTASPVSGDALLAIAQRGIIAALPSKLGGKAFTHDLTYYETSGALKSYTLASKPLVDKGALDALSGAANDLLDARNKQREAEANAGFNALKRESDTIELLLEKQKNCLQLANPPDECGDL